MYRSGVAGIGRYSQNLINNLLAIDRDDEFVLFMTKEDYREFNNAKCQMPNVKIIQTEIKHFTLAEQTKFGKIIEKEKLDLMHFLNFNHPVSYKGKFIITIHDLTLFHFPDTAKKTNFIKRAAFRYVMSSACKNAVKILADSKSTKNDIEKVFKTESRRIDVIYFAADDKTFLKIEPRQIEQIKKKYKVETPVILTVSQFRPHKNLVGLVEAFGLLRKEMPCRLVILGKPDPKHTSLKEAVERSPFKNDIIMPGFVSDEDLAAWYKIATCFVFPSLYEGFGLPGLEAMQAGTPVVASNTSSLPEIYRDAAIYFDPFQTEDISAKIKAVLENEKLRVELSRKGKIQAQCFSWKKTASETLDLYQQIQNA